MAVRLLVDASKQGCREATQSIAAILYTNPPIAFRQEATQLVTQLLAPHELPPLPQSLLVRPTSQQSLPSKRNSAKKRRKKPVLNKFILGGKTAPQTGNHQSRQAKRGEHIFTCPFCPQRVPEFDFPAHMATVHDIRPGTRFETPIQNLSYPNAIRNCHLCFSPMTAQSLKRHIQEMHPESLGSAGYIHWVQGGRGGH